MKWKSIINGAPLGSGDAISVVSGGYAPHRKEWIGLALAGASLATSIFGGIQSAKAQREAQRRQAEEKAKNDAWYSRRYNEHTIDTAAGQNMIRMAKEAARENWKKAEGAAAVGGASEAATAMAKESGNRMIGNTIAQIEAQDTARKDNVDAAYRARSAELSQQQIALDQQKAGNISQVAGGVSDALLSGALHFAGSSNNGSPGGGGVNPAPKTSAVEKLGIDSNEKWLKNNQQKIYDNNKNYNLLQGVMGDLA